VTKNCRPRHIWRDLLKKFWPFHAQTVVELNKTGRVATRPRHCFDEARAHRVRDLCKHDWYGSRGLQQRSHRIIAAHNDRVGRKSEQLGRILENNRACPAAPGASHPYFFPFTPTNFLKKLKKGGGVGAPSGFTQE